MKTKTGEQTYDSEGKQKVRQYIVNTINSTRSPSFFELHGAGLMYKKVKKETNARIMSIDCDPLIAKKMKNKKETYFGTIKEFCEEKEDQFNILWLDYCGLFTETGARDDIRVIPKIMKNSGTFFMTINHGREPYIEGGTKRDDIEKLHYYLIKELFADNGIKVTHTMTILYPSIALYKIGKRKKKGATTMKVYEYKWKRVENCQNHLLERFDNTKTKLAIHLF